jgi:2-polyprenyl-3-methyl-5-hydroxy-6-metoxy-1,4-benzoquinol methylase
MILLNKCPVCDGQKLTPKLDCLDHTTSKETFTIVSCGTCDFTFTNPRPLNENLGDYYKSEMYISHTNNTKGVFNWMYQNVRNYTIGTKVSLLKSIKKTGTHLDIGCGTGEFLDACKLSGFITKGIEPSELARKQAINNHGLNISSNTNLSQYTDLEFDSISMWHVLEHVTNLNETIKQLHRILKPDGKIIIAVPNHKSWDAKFYQEFWAAWDVPIHLWHFSKETIEHLFKNSNFSLEKIKPMKFDSFYVSLLSEEFKTGKKNFITGFIIGFISNLAGIFTKSGHSSSIYVFKKITSTSKRF